MRPEAPSELDDVREAEQPRAASPAMTEEELNQLAADVLQAEIMGQEVPACTYFFLFLDCFFFFFSPASQLQHVFMCTCFVG